MTSTGAARPPQLSVLIPAYNEASRIAASLAAVDAALSPLYPEGSYEVIVVDDGSRDETAAVARATGRARVIELGRNQGKGGALQAALSASRGELLVMLDADLERTADQFPRLLAPLEAGQADMAVARFQRAARGGGFGLAVGLARWGVRRLTGRELAAPLSGQRAFTREVWERVGRIAPGFGAEVGLDVDVLRAGFRLVEVPTEMRHQATGRDWAGFRHRARQFAAVARTLLNRALRR